MSLEHKPKELRNKQVAKEEELKAKDAEQERKARIAAEKEQAFIDSLKRLVEANLCPILEVVNRAYCDGKGRIEVAESESLSSIDYLCDFDHRGQHELARHS